MPMTGAQLTDEIQTLVGRTTSSEPLITNARCTRWQNEGQVEIVQYCPGLHCLSFKNTESLDTTQSLQYAISEISVSDDPTDAKVCRIWDVYYLDGNESVRLTPMFVDEFDEKYPDPTHSDIAITQPTHWTRRGQYIEIFPLSLCAYCDKDLRFDGDFWPRDFTTEDATVSDISGADEGIIMYGVAQAWGAIGNETKAVIWERKFRNWLDDFKAQNDNMHEWEGNLFDEELA
jgi:hypothetical protein